jgi:hypothetical protein
MASKTASASNLACSTTVQPCRKAGSVWMFSPPTWNSGRVVRIRSALVRPCMSAAASALAASARCDSSTPLGSPVDPEVKHSRIGSSGSTGAGGVGAPAWAPSATNPAQSCQPGGVAGCSPMPGRATAFVPSGATCACSVAATNSASTNSRRGAARASRARCSAGARRQFSGMKIAPSRAQANSADSMAALLVPSQDTRSPAATPCRCRAAVRVSMHLASPAKPGRPSTAISAGWPGRAAATA